MTERAHETRLMLRLRKRELAAGLQEGESTGVAELTAIDRLETRLATRERIARVREATRSRGTVG
jgi:hypothetical protein